MAEKIIENKDLFADDAFKKTVDDVKLLVAELEKLEGTLKTVAKSQSRALKKPDNRSVKGLNAQKEAIDKINSAEKTHAIINKKKLALENRLKIARSDKTQSNVRLGEQVKQQNLRNRQSVKEINKVFGAYTNLSTRLNRLRKEYKDLAAAGKAETKEGRKKLKYLNQLDSKLKKIDQTVGQSQRKVGNYTNAWNKLGSTIKRGLVALGIVGGIRQVARAFGDAARRVKEFDSAMATLRGLTGNTSKELAGVKQEIIDVAGSSRKTSNEVAKLATVLIKLGKSKRDVINLLEPINDLAIGLGVSSDAAADFLGQTLNAFGETSEKGQEFADIISNVAKSTSLDFERIKEALGYVAPTAKALNLTLGRTSAIVGVLQDNGIKAARAGRLLSSSFLRLASRGKSLEQALDDINEAQKNGADRLAILKVASDNFGVRSAALGFILANNRDRVDELANSFDNLSKGALKQLVDEQLDTLAGKIDIMDSAYERFILSIENGEGPISKAFKSTITWVTKLIDRLTFLNNSVEDFATSAAKEQREYVNSIIKAPDKAISVFLRLKSEIVKAQKELKKAAEDTKDKDKFLSKYVKSGGQGLQAYKDAQKREGMLQKRLDLLQEALKNPGEFLKGEAEKAGKLDKILEAAVGKAKKLKKIDLIDRDVITKLQGLKDELKAITKLREKLVTSTDKGDIKAFNALTEQADQLQKVIDVYERLLKNEKPDEKKPIKGKLSDFDQANLDKSRKLEEESLKQFEDLVSDSLRTIGTLVDNLFVTKLNNLNDNLQSTQRRTDQLIQKAETSRLTAQESIAFEQKKEAELERERQKALKKQQQAQAFSTVLQAYQANVANNSQSPLTDTVRDIGILRALAQSFGSAFDGVDDTGGRGEVDKKGGKFWVLHPREQVWSEKNRKEVGYKSRDEIIDIVKSNESANLISSEVLSNHGGITRELAAKNSSSQVVKKLDQLNRSIENIKIPEGTVSIDQVRKLINVKMKSGNKTKLERSRLYD